MVKKDVGNFPTPEEHFKDVGRSLSFLRRNIDFTDLHFICNDSTKDKKSFKRVQCHKAMFGPHSSLLTQLFNIANEKDPSGTVSVNLDGIDFTTMEKIVEYIYLGQTTVKNPQKLLMLEAVKVLDLNIEVSDDKLSSSSSGSESEESVEAPPRKKLFRNPAARLNLNQEKKWKEDAEKTKTSVKVSRLEECEDEETKKYVEKIEATRRASQDQDQGSAKKPRLVKNPAVQDSTIKKNPVAKTEEIKELKTTPAKREEVKELKITPAKREEVKELKITPAKKEEAKELKVPPAKKEEVKEVKVPPAKKEEVKEVKVPSAKKEEVKEVKITPAKTTLEKPKDPEAKPAPKSASIKKKPKAGPASKTNRNGASSLNSTVTQEPKQASLSDDFEVQPCNVCNVFLISSAALKAHMRKEHGEELTDEEKKENPKPASSASNKPGPRSKKKPETILNERKSRESRISTTSSSGSDSEEEKPKNGVAKPSPATKKAGPSSKKKSKPGPMSKRRRSSVSDHERQTKIKKLSSSDDGGDEPVKSSEKKKPKIRIAFNTKTTPKSATKARPLCLQNSGRGGGGGEPSPCFRQCNMCEEKYDKTSNMKNHVLNHFRKDLMPMLTSGLRCPKCDQPSRDKTTLLRHFAFSHKMIHEYCSEENLKGKPISYEEYKNGNPSPKSRSTPSNRPGPKNSKSKARVSSSSDSDEPKEKPNKKDSRETDAKDSKTEDAPKKESDNPQETKKPDPCSAMTFSSDSDDGMMNATATKATKSFDELFGSELKEKED